MARALVVVAVLALSLAGFTPVGAQADVTLWVTLGDGDQLVEVDPYTFKEVRRITVDPKVHGLAISADGSKVYIASDRTGNFQVIDARAASSRSRSTSGPIRTSSRSRATASSRTCPCAGEDMVAVVQLEPLKLIKKIAVPKGPHDAYTSADGRRIVVGAQYGSAIIAIDPKTGSCSTRSRRATACVRWR